jgi:hypothetical protein
MTRGHRGYARGSVATIEADLAGRARRRSDASGQRRSGRAPQIAESSAILNRCDDRSPASQPRRDPLPLTGGQLVDQRTGAREGLHRRN